MASLQDIRRRITLGPEHAQDHEGAGARRRRPAAPRADADRGDAAVRRPDAGADGRDGARRVVVPEPRAAAAARRGEARRDRLVTGDRGLAGPFNGQVLRRAFELEREARANGQEVLWLVIGPQGRVDAALPRATSSPASGPASPTSRRTRDAQAVAHRLAELYVAEEVDRVVLVYNRFVSALVQRVTTSDLLPIPEDVLERATRRRATSSSAPSAATSSTSPSRRRSSQRLLPVYLETEIYRALLESAASFLASQMTAMRNASKNAGELIDRLTLAMNRARQAEITQEILEVVAGADALAG